MSRYRDTPLRAFLLSVAVILAVIGLVDGESIAWGQTDAESTESEDSTLTWSVRPSPTDAEPDRPNYVYDLEPGETVNDSIRVRNYTTDPLVLDIYASDAITTVSGALDLLPADQTATDVGTWVELESSSIEVPSQSALDVPFTVTAPERAEPGDHTGGIVTSFLATGSQGGQEVVVEHRLGSRMHVRVDGPLQPGLEVSGLNIAYDETWNPAASSSAHVTYTVTNTGNVRAGVEQLVSTPDWMGFFGREATPETINELLPGNSLEVTVDIDAVWPTFRTTVDVEATPVPVRGGDVFDSDTPAATGSITVWSMPWPQLAVLLLVVAGFFGFRWNRRRRKRRQAAIVDEAVKEALATGAEERG